MSESYTQPSEPQYAYPNEPYSQGPHPGGSFPPAAPPSYGSYGYNAAAAEASTAATTSLVLGIISVVLLPLLGPLAIWQAAKAEKLGRPATAGKVLGWIGSAFLAIGVVIFAFFIIAMIAGASATGF
ncbi:DUF4190 domain-containing protein [Georgenia yuyongxinii]|uniref:DUF4190 domain-containing protein n=1 Tax=Georgenia yuyongxinii TaxID=2589797 RepID=A0A552WUA8_9MICO|nr:DUF4190 domain-containing protein [Georgenia yuyongxinii]TRW46430.1 DUF4190 domain-containing protein [Georgenia yuyongxinii]